MTKKPHKKNVQPEKPVSKPVAKPDVPVKQRGFELVRFDRKTNIFIGASLILYIVFVMFKLHNSSIPIWNQIINEGNQKRGLISGKPLSIRSDEWLVVSSFILAQEKGGFPVSNEALGYGKTPIIMNLPTSSAVSIVRPALWGYYFLDIERGFSWQWNFKIFPFLIGAFLLLMLFTKNNFWISSLGSIWIYLTSVIQWWSITTEMFTFACFTLVSFIYILYSKKPWVIAFNGLLFFLAFFSFIMILYPATQVPIGYFLIALLIGYYWMNKENVKFVFDNTARIKGVVLLGSLSLLAFFAYLFYHECKETIDVITNTVYPGKRNVQGGDLPFPRLFTDNVSLFMSESKFPSVWGNICELSAGLMLIPVVMILFVINYIRTKKVDVLMLGIVIFHLVTLIWIFIGFPEFLAKLTLLNMSPSNRTFLVVIFTNIVGTLIFISRTPAVKWKNNYWYKIIAFVGIYIVVYYFNTLLNENSELFFSSQQIIQASLIFTALNWLVIYYHEKKIFQISFFVICILFVISNVKINPVCKGLSPYLESNFYKLISKVRSEDPKAGWVSYGQITISNFLKAAGANCFSGVQYAPPLEKLHLLDRYNKNDSIYNRYAHIAFSPFVDGTDSISFKLNQNDLYSIQMDPCSPTFDKLGIKYFVFSYRPHPLEVRCMLPVDTNGIFVYRKN